MLREEVKIAQDFNGNLDGYFAYNEVFLSRQIADGYCRSEN